MGCSTGSCGGKAKAIFAQAMLDPAAARMLRPTASTGQMPPPAAPITRLGRAGTTPAGPQPERSASELFQIIQRALQEGRTSDIVRALAAQFNAARLKELSTSGILQQIQTAAAAGPLRTAVWLGWTKDHSGDPFPGARSQEARPLSVASIVETRDSYWSNTAVFLVSTFLEAVARFQSPGAGAPPYNPFAGSESGWFVGLGLDGQPEPLVLFYPRPIGRVPQPLPAGGR